jgi:hypothetical protein
MKNNVSNIDVLTASIDRFMIDKQNKKPKYLSASLKQQQERDNETLRNTCHNCGCTQDDVFLCPSLVLNL